MKGMVWVGKVKSTTPATLIEEAFKKFGLIKKVETGFSGYAYVEFDRDEDAEAALSMNWSKLPDGRTIMVERATYKGYLASTRDKEQLKKTEGREAKELPPKSKFASSREFPGSRDLMRRSVSRSRERPRQKKKKSSRSRSEKRQRYRSKSRSGGRRRSPSSPSVRRPKAKSCSKSKSKSRSRSPERSLEETVAKMRALIASKAA